MSLGQFLNLHNERRGFSKFIKIRYHDSQGLSEGLGICIFMLQFSSVAQLCSILCDPMDCIMPGLPVHQQLMEFMQTHVHCVSDAIQPQPGIQSEEMDGVSNDDVASDSKYGTTCLFQGSGSLL